MKKKLAGILLAFALVFGAANPAGATASPFTDIPETHWAYWDIYFLWVGGSISGYTDGNFRPNNVVTRAEASKIIAQSLEVREANPGNGLSNARFTDVPATHWSYPYVQTLADRGVISGVTPTQFQPNAALTRAQMAKILSGAYELPSYSPAGFTGFKDVNVNSWYGDDVNRLLHAGITQGYAGGLYKPNEFVTRAQLAAFVNRALQYKQEQANH